jgi:class 3 adenylate cyclase
MDLIGKSVSHYKVLDRLGAGGMGAVYLAHDIRLDRPVAMKFLRPDITQNGAETQRLELEARAASSLDHPNIGVIYEIDKTPEIGLFIVMAYYPGESLQQRLSRGPLKTALAIDIAKQLADALACAHERGIIHRDVKPGNVMLTASGLVKLLDFGVAKVKDVHLTKTGIVIGTPAFMAPEQMMGKAVDHRCDIWSLGALLYNMISGELPFEADGLMELLQKIHTNEPVLPGAPECIQHVVARALERDPADRFSNMADFGRDLRRAAMEIQPGYHAATTTCVLSTNAATVYARQTPEGGLPSSGWSEMRQVAVVSCDITEFADFGDELDPEDLESLLTAYHTKIGDIAQRFGGRIAQALDAEVRVVFGFPRAQEDDARRAVRAAVEIRDSVQALLKKSGENLSSLSTALGPRIGVHVGVVLTESGEVSGVGNRMIGTTGAVAAKVQQGSRSGAVVVTGETLSLLQNYFLWKHCGDLPATGRASTIALYEITGQNEGWQTRDAIPLVAREREIGALLEAWESAKQGAGRAILITGEAGIGKSRLLNAFLEEVAAGTAEVLEARCSPLERNSPLGPLLDIIKRKLGVQDSQTREARAAQIRSFFENEGLANLGNSADLLSLLSPEPDTREMSTLPQRAREKSFAVIFSLLVAVSEKIPLVLVIEDLHWADPTTIDWLGLFVQQGPPVPILTVLTARPEFKCAWMGRADVTILSVGRLNTKYSRELITRVAGNVRLPDSVIDQLLKNCEGIPLFLEELTKAVLALPSGRYVDASPVTGLQSAITVPPTLKASLLARLDRLGTAKRVAQIASFLGRNFSYDLLSTVADMDSQELDSGLNKLLQAELLYRRGIAPSIQYSFKHALIKDAAYSSLPNATKRSLHAKTAEALEKHFPGTAETQPELLARHYMAAGLGQRAISYLLRAGQRALNRSANLEAAAIFQTALGLLRTLTEDSEHRQIEWRLWLMLGNARLSIAGYGADAVHEAFERSRQLCETAGASRELFDALQGLFAFYIVRAELKKSLELALRLQELATSLGDMSLQSEAMLRYGVALYARGDLELAREKFAEVLATDEQKQENSTVLYGQDRTVACFCHLALADWLCGDSDASRQHLSAANDRARELKHPFTMTWPHLYTAIVDSMAGDHESVLRCSELLESLCREHGFAYRLAQAKILNAWARAMLTDVREEGISELAAYIREAELTGARVFRPFYSVLLGKLCVRLRATDKGRAAIELGFKAVSETGERFFEPELYRLRGDLQGLEDLHVAMSAYRQAMDTAVELGAFGLEKQAAQSLAALSVRLLLHDES